MGTNFYYHRKPACSHCGQEKPGNEVHIGKSSYGWAFALHVACNPLEEEDIPRDLEGWLELFVVPNSWITDEYGQEISREKMISTIRERGHGKFCPLDKSPQRHTIDNKHCIAHGSGPWDLCPGEFS